MPHGCASDRPLNKLMDQYQRYHYDVLFIPTGERPKPIDAELWYFPPGTEPAGTPTFFRRFSGETNHDAWRLVMIEFRAWVAQGAPNTWPEKCRRCTTILRANASDRECQRCRKGSLA